MATIFQSQHPYIIAAFGFVVVYTFHRLTKYGLALRRRSLISRKHGCKPFPRFHHSDPIFGLDVFFENVKLLKRGEFLDRIEGRYLEMKSWTYTQLLLGDPIIQTAEPENIKAILATQFKDFPLPSRRKAALGPVFGHGIFTTDGKEWEISRALLRPNFTRSQVGDINTFEKHILKLLSKIPTDGSTVDLQALFFSLTMDSATEFLFGHSTNVLDPGLTSERGKKFEEHFTYVTEKIGLESRVGKLAKLFLPKKFEQSKAYVHEYVREYVHKAVELHKLEKEGKAEDSSRYVFLEELAKTGYDEKKIQDELLNVLLAGRDTTASLLSYLFYILARRPDVLSKLREEVLALGYEPPTFEEIKSMKFLGYCLNETLRIHPIVPANGREAIVDTTLPVGGGPDGKSPILVKKGQQVNYQVYVMHRRKDLYGEDADEFKPERWEHLRPSWQYLPFNGGPRICIGQQFALIEASYTTIRLLQAFKAIEPRDDTSLRDILTLTAAVRGGVKVGMVPA